MNADPRTLRFRAGRFAVALLALACLARSGAAQPAGEDDDDALAQRAGEKLADASAQRGRPLTYAEMQQVLAESTAPLLKQLRQLIARGRRSEAERMAERIRLLENHARAVMSAIDTERRREARAAQAAARAAKRAASVKQLPALCSDAERKADQAEVERLAEDSLRQAQAGKQTAQQRSELKQKRDALAVRCVAIATEHAMQANLAAVAKQPLRIPGVEVDVSTLQLVAFAKEAELHHDEVSAARASAVYDRRLPLDTRALDFWDRTVGWAAPDDIDGRVEDDAILHAGQRGRIVDGYLRAIKYLEQDTAAAPGEPKLAARLTGLAAIYRLQGAHSKAEQALRRALDLRKQAFGPAAPEVAATLTSLGTLYQAQGAYDKAEPLLLQALDLRRQGHAADLDVARSLHALGLLYEDRGAYDKAEAQLREALDILDRTRGPNDAAVATCLENLAEVLEARGAPDQAEPLLARAAELREARLDAELLPLNDHGKRAVMTLLQGETDHVVSLQADATPSREPTLALTTVLRRKARVVDEGTALRVRATPEIQSKLDELAKAREDQLQAGAQLAGTQTARDVAGPARARSLDPDKLLGLRIPQLEADLAAAASSLPAPPPVEIPDVQAQLPPGAALIEFVRYRRFDARHAGQPWREDRYVAYLLAPQGPPQSVALGDAATIDASVDAAIAAMRAPPRGRERAALAKARATLQRLQAQVLAPIVARLPAGTAQLIIAPDDELGLAPFEALLDPQGRYAAERWLISHVTSGTELLRFVTPDPAQSPAVLIAAPDYGPASRPAAPGPIPKYESLFPPLPPLPGALAEARDLQPYFATPTLTGPAATKDAVRALRGPAMLHIATHAFASPSVNAAAFLAMREGMLATAARGPATRGVDIATAAPDVADAPVASPPRVRDQPDDTNVDALALAGANRGLEGHLTSTEIAHLDWHGTQLVVLSACETGVGVFGMRRAVTLAGAAAQVVSLWRADDGATRELMRALYRGLAGGAGRAEALRQAKLGLLHQPGYEHPYFWAAFVHAGDWRPLPAGTLRAP